MKELINEFNQIDGDYLIAVWNVWELIESRFSEYEFSPDESYEILKVFRNPENLSVVIINSEIDSVNLEDRSIYSDILGLDYEKKDGTEHFQFIENIIQRYLMKKKSNLIFI